MTVEKQIRDVTVKTYEVEDKEFRTEIDHKGMVRLIITTCTEVILDVILQEQDADRLGQMISQVKWDANWKREAFEKEGADLLASEELKAKQETCEHLNRIHEEGSADEICTDCDLTIDTTKEEKDTQ